MGNGNGVIIIQSGSSAAKVVGIIIIVIAIFVVIAMSYTDVIRAPFEGGEMTITLYDRDGRPIKVIDPNSPLAVLQLSFTYGGVEIAWIEVKVAVDVDTNVQFNYDVKLNTTLWLRDPSSGQRFKINSRIDEKTGTASDDFNVTFYISESDLEDMIAFGPGTKEYFSVSFQALVTLSSGVLEDGKESDVVFIDIEWQPDGYLSIVSVSIVPDVETINEVR